MRIHRWVIRKLLRTRWEFVANWIAYLSRDWHEHWLDLGINWPEER